jgi:hypothetical protein
MRFGPTFALTLSHFLRGRYDDAANNARKTFQASPNWSFSHMLLAATLVQIGRTEEAKRAAQRLVELQPGYTIGSMCAALPIAPVLAAPLSDALRAAGLPE